MRPLFVGNIVPSSLNVLQIGWNLFLQLFGVQVYLHNQYQPNFLNRLSSYNTQWYKVYDQGFYKFHEDNACNYARYPYGENYNQKITFDYIIVGAGPAGCVLANRLSENPMNKVLLIEAGDDPSVISLIPRLSFLELGTISTFNYSADIVRTSGTGFDNGTPMRCGRVIGGGTAINAMMYICGTDADYNEWAYYLKDESFRYENMLNYIKRSENNENRKLLGKYHSQGGPLNVKNFGDTDELNKVLIESSKYLGYEYLGDYNSQRGYNGVFDVQGTVKNGEHWGAGRAFLLPIVHRKNLKVLKKGFVSQIFFEGSVATGVEIKTEIQKCPTISMFKAKKEVIISAGALNSPGILQRSGIGNAEDLKALNIPVRNNLQVGYNLQDHLCMITFITLDDFTNEDPLKYLSRHAIEYLNEWQRGGVFAHLGLVQTNLFMNVNSTSPFALPDFQMINFLFNVQLPRERKEELLRKVGLPEVYVQQLLDISEKNH